MTDNFKNKQKVFIGGAFIGAIIFLIIYGFSVLNVTNDSFLINGYIEKDIAQHYAGWMLFRDSPWQFPLGVGQNLAYPYGTSVSYTDSIPIFAIFFKLFRSILPSTFQYFGIFCMICFMLQGAFGALISNLFSNNFFYNLISASVLTLSPVIIERAFRHCALTAHFLILASLYYYLKNKGNCSFKAVLPFFIINGLAITIHPYFLPFTFAIMFAFCIENFFIKKEYIKNVLYILSSIFVTIFIGYSIGAFYGNTQMGATGYGLFSMNLNSLYNPISKGFSNWSTIMEIKPTLTGYQIEGFNFLGLGIILFIPISIIICLFKFKNKIFKTILTFIKNYFGIIFSALSLFIFAVGDWVSFGGLRLFKLPIPSFIINSIGSIFRANGRFGWLVVYLIVILVLYSISRSNYKFSNIIITLLLFTQIIDMRNVIISKHSYFTNSEDNVQSQYVNNLLCNPFWDDASEKYAIGYMLFDNIDNRSIDFASKFGKNNHAVNSGFTARVDTERFYKQRDAIFNEIANGNFSSNEILFIDSLQEEIKTMAKNNGYSVFLIDNIYAICKNKFTDEEISSYLNKENFSIL